MRIGEGETREGGTIVRAVVAPLTDQDGFFLRVVRYDGEKEQAHYLAWAPVGQVPMFEWRPYRQWEVLPAESRLRFDGHPSTAGKAMLKSIGLAIKASGVLEE